MTDRKKEILKDLMLDRNYQHFNQNDSIYHLIISNSANALIEDTTTDVMDAIERSVKHIIVDKLHPRLRFEHVQEHGLLIWGKALNMAISFSTMREFLKNMRMACEPESFEQSLVNIGRRSAYEFFNTFHNILYIDNTHKVPINTVQFMRTLCEFDTNSSWWKEIQLQEEGEYYSFVVKSPFFRYPWLEMNNHDFSIFIKEYLHTLYNASADYIRVVYLFYEWGKPKSFSHRAKLIEERDPVNTYVRIYEFNKYYDPFEEIDFHIFYLTERLYSLSFDRIDFPLIFDNFDKTIEKINSMKNAPEKLNIKSDNIISNLDMLRENYTDKNPTLLIFYLKDLLKDLRAEYDQARIQYFNKGGLCAEIED